MSRFLGQIRQAGYVVPNIEEAMDYWSCVLGVGPFFYSERVPIRNYRYRGQSYEPHNSVALANSGPLQIELIQTRNDVPSMYRDFIEAGHSGLQHIAYWTDNYDPDLERLTAQGFAPVMSGEVGERGRFVYFLKFTGRRSGLWAWRGLSDGVGQASTAARDRTATAAGERAAADRL